MTQQAQRTNFSNVLTWSIITRESTKPLFRKRFMVYGKVLAAASEAFQMGGILACRFRNHAQPFITVLGSPSDAATMVQIMTTKCAANVASRAAAGCSILDYVVNSEMDAFKFEGAHGAFYWKHGGTKVARETAAKIIHYYMMDGVSLGLSDPDRFRELFEQSYSFDEESMRKWKQARAAGVDIPETPDVLHYAECEAEAVKMFSEYCREIYPDFAPSLGL